MVSGSNAGRVRVGYDREIFCSQIAGGVSRYFASIIEEFKDRSELGVDVEELFRRSINEHLSADSTRLIEPQLLREALLIGSRAANRFGNSGIRHGLFSAIGGPTPAAHAVDVIHITGYSPRPRDLMVGTPIAMTIHDLIPTLFPEYWKGWNPHRDRGSIVTKASVIFVPSEVTKVDLLEFEGELHCEIIVVPHGVNPKIFTTNSDDKVRRIDFPYFLFIGRRSRYKRFGLLLEALSNVRLRGHDVGLVIVGGGRLSHDEKSLVGAALPGDRFCHESSSDYGLAQLLRQAEALCFPSKIEGFGLPILEAMACGCPCVLSDIPIFREVSGNSALFFDSESVESLTQEMIQIISDLRLRETLVKVGTTRAESLTWRRAAETVASGYRSIL